MAVGKATRPFKAFPSVQASCSDLMMSKAKRGEIMQIQVDVSNDVWQKFCLLCTGKDPTTVLTEMVENAWRVTHPENKKLP